MELDHKKRLVALHTRNPSHEVASTTMPRRIRHSEIHHVVTCTDSRKKKIFHPVTVNFDV